MINSHIDDLDLRSQKCGHRQNNNNNHNNINKQANDNDDDDDTSSTCSDEAQTRKRNTEYQSQPKSVKNFHSLSEMSTPAKSKTTTHSSSLAQNLDSGKENERYNADMWRNELQQSEQLVADVKPDQNHRNSISKYSDIIDIGIRIAIVLGFIKLETMSPFKREIHPEELWLYKNPRRPDIVRGDELLLSVIGVPLFLTIIFYVMTKDRRDFRAASWAWTMAVCMNSIPTSLLKITVGRPRPDFFYRCFPDGIMVLNETASALGSVFIEFNCTGKLSDINEGRKSFPSGHSSFAFASFGFVSFYVGAKLHAFDTRGRGHTWRLCIAVMPLIVAALVAISRTCDYHHHWQDVVVGALIGLVSGYFSYRQYYPSIFSPDAGTPFVRWWKYSRLEAKSMDEAGDDLTRPLLGKQPSSKWH
ncbi:phospholipid phosphatase 5 isoform X2 [Drosophila grimshawi]|uniref:phospholipid phosphatase 5 isoform X2 n=1 Tax=Drosophila grimshawi TaxID=7222 RepID=UPI000C86F2B6|nr:phospholipid phosphatase 5 isoform X2 [Drosophila grimshawi]